VYYVQAKRRIDELKISRRKRWCETRLSTFFISNWLSRRKTRGFIFTENTQFDLLLALTQGTCKIKEKLVQLHCCVAFSSSAGSEKRLFIINMRGEWHCMTARSFSARAGVKRIYMRMPDSCTKASTCFSAAVLRRISGVEKFVPISSTACFRRRRASVNLVQTSVTCSTVSGILHWSQNPSGRRPMRDIRRFSWQWPVHKRKIIAEREWVDREDRSRAGKITLYAFPLISVWYWISHAWKECWYRYGSLSVKFNRVFTRL